MRRGFRPLAVRPVAKTRIRCRAGLFEDAIAKRGYPSGNAYSSTCRKPTSLLAPLSPTVCSKNALSLSSREPLVKGAGDQVSAVTVGRRHPGMVWAMLGVIAVLDQLTKRWALESLDGGRVIDIVWTLRLRLVFNTGSAFGRFGGFGSVLGVVAFAMVVWLLCSRAIARDRVSSIAVGCIAGGAIGNLADRLLRAESGFLSGAVVDFVDVQWWPVWNVADMGIVLGGGVLMWSVWRRHAECGAVAEHQSAPSETACPAEHGTSVENATPTGQRTDSPSRRPVPGASVVE